jgi:hypothetical protein
MIRSAAAAVLGLALCSASVSDAAGPAEARLALVIGNAAYAEGRLRNPVNDARAVARTLRTLGFEVIVRENASYQDMRRAIGEFGDRLRQSGVGLFYYAGHGMQVNGRNFMIPLGARIRSERMMESEALDVATVLGEMDAAKTRLNIVILDACRDNPFARSFRSSAQGLAPIDAPTGTLIAYATGPGRVARDGEGDQGLYTGELVKAMTVPGLRIEDVFKQVRLAVAQRTREEQVPWESSSLVGDFRFVAAPAPGPAGGQPPRGYGPPLGSLRLGLGEQDVQTALGTRLKLHEEYRGFITHSAENVLFLGDRGRVLIQIDKQRRTVTSLTYVLQPTSSEAGVRAPELQPAVRLALDLEALLVDRAVMTTAEHREIRQRGGAAVSPVADVMTLPEANSAAREATAAVAMVQRPTEGRRNRPRPGADFHHAPVGVVAHDHPAGVAGQALGRSSWNACPVLQDRLARLPGVRQDLGVHMDDDLVTLSRCAGIDPMVQGRLRQQRQGVGLLLGRRRRSSWNVGRALVERERDRSGVHALPRGAEPAFSEHRRHAPTALGQGCQAERLRGGESRDPRRDSRTPSTTWLAMISGTRNVGSRLSGSRTSGAIEAGSVATSRAAVVTTKRMSISPSTFQAT